MSDLEVFQKAYAEYLLAYGREECASVVESHLEKVQRAVADLMAAIIVEKLMKDDLPWYRWFELRRHK